MTRARFTPALAFAWTALVTSGLWLALGWLFAVLGRKADDIALLGLTQVLVYSIALGAFGYALQTPVRVLFGLRRAPLMVCLAAVALGAALQVPASLLAKAVEHFFPTPPEVLAERVARITPHSALHALSILLVVAALGPLVEELFFRGALFGALRQGYGVASTLFVTSACFALAHLDGRLLLPLLLAAAVIGLVREYSGSLWPSLCVHGGFNAATLQLVFAGAAPRGKPPEIPANIAMLGCALTLLLFATVRRLALASDTQR